MPEAKTKPLSRLKLGIGCLVGKVVQVAALGIAIPAYNALRPVVTEFSLNLAHSGRIGIDFLLSSEYVLNQIFGIAVTAECLALPAEIIIFGLLLNKNRRR